MAHRVSHEVFIHLEQTLQKLCFLLIISSTLGSLLMHQLVEENWEFIDKTLIVQNFTLFVLS